MHIVTIVFLLQLAFLTGTALLFMYHGGSIVHEIGGQDAREYMLLGEQLLDSGEFRLPDKGVPETWRTPGYPFFVAVNFALTNHSLTLLLVVLALVGALTSGLMYLIGLELSLSPRAAFAAGLLFGVSPAVIWIPPSAMGGDILFIFLLTAALFILVRLIRIERWYFATIGLGLLLGAATLVRPLGLYLSLILIASTPFFLPHTDLRKKMLCVLIAIVGFALITTP